MGQRYTYRRYSRPAELKEILSSLSPEIVVLDTHGDYNEMLDQLTVYLGTRPANARDFVPAVQVPAVWILSACEMAVVGAITASLVGNLLERGAICVIATLQKIDALAASIFVGRLLTEIYSPAIHGAHENLSEAFFNAQLTTSCLYDPILPLLRKAEHDTRMKAIYTVIIEFIAELADKPMNPRLYRNQASRLLYERLSAHGLLRDQADSVISGQVTPQSLLFSAFGAPTRNSA